MDMSKLQTPIEKKEIEKLTVGELVALSGELVTARDSAHAFLVGEKKKLPFSLEGGVLYHMGPIVKHENNILKIISAGPTTSIREELYESEIIRTYGVRAIIGKGGMGEKTKKALQEFGAVYLSAVGGIAGLLAEHIIEVLDVFKLEEFGTPEAMWRLKIKDFPTIVTMDSKGNSLHEDIEKRSFEQLKKLLL